MTLSAANRVWRELCLAILIVLLAAPPAMAQATSTFNGRVLDQGDAVLPGVTVTATNTSTGVTRTTVTNDEGAYYIPGLDPGVYDVKTELPGFAPADAERVTLGHQRDDHARFQAGAWPAWRDGHRDRRGAADRGDAVEDGLDHRNDGARRTCR